MIRKILPVVLSIALVPTALLAQNVGANSWHATSGNAIPSGAFVGGNAGNGAPIYVCRVQSGQVQVPGRIMGPQSGATGCRYIQGGVSSVETSSHEVLMSGNFAWQAWTGTVPANAVYGGIGSANNNRYICRTSAPGKPNTAIPGKFRPERPDAPCMIDYIGSNGLAIHQTATNVSILVEN